MNNQFINLKNPHIILMSYRLLYDFGAYEFLSEFLYYSKFYFSKEDERKEVILELIEYALSKNKIIISKGYSDKKGIEVKYTDKNYSELVSKIDKLWLNFNNPDETLIWYLYQIDYTSEWKNELKKLNLWTE